MTEDEYLDLLYESKINYQPVNEDITLSDTELSQAVAAIGVQLLSDGELSQAAGSAREVSANSIVLIQHCLANIKHCLVQLRNSFPARISLS